MTTNVNLTQNSQSFAIGDIGRVNLSISGSFDGGKIIVETAQFYHSIDFQGDIINTSGAQIDNCSIDISKIPNKKGLIKFKNINHNNFPYSKGFQKLTNDATNPTSTLRAFDYLNLQEARFGFTESNIDFEFFSIQLISFLQIYNKIPSRVSINGDQTEIATDGGVEISTDGFQAWVFTLTGTSGNANINISINASENDVITNL